MSKTRKTPGKSEINIFSRSLPHYESFVKASGSEDYDLKYFAEVATNRRMTYVARIEEISGKLELDHMDNSAKREYFGDILHSLEDGLNRSIKRSIKRQNVSRYAILNSASVKLSNAYDLIEGREDASLEVQPRQRRESLEVKPLEVPSHQILRCRQVRIHGA